MHNKKIMVSGIQPSNNITLGNYLGAIKPFVDLQNKYKMFVFIADLHAITNEFNPPSLLRNKKNIACLYSACGLDLKKVIIFNQSDICSHNDLSHVLLCHTTIGELKRMTQFKSKALTKNANNTSFIKTGLLTYPILMAADILLYDASIVIVGADQKQHLELARNLAIRMNNKYGKMFIVPQPLILKNASRIMDLANVKIKMSKSNKDQKGVIYLLDDKKTIIKKIMEAKTDSINKIKYDKKNQPEISNLLEIYAALSTKDINSVVKKYENKNYKVFKEDLAKIVVEKLSVIQKKFKQISKDFDKKIEPILKKNAKYCTAIVQKKTKLVYKKIGLIQ